MRGRIGLVVTTGVLVAAAPAGAFGGLDASTGQEDLCRQGPQAAQERAGDAVTSCSDAELIAPLAERAFAVSCPEGWVVDRAGGGAAWTFYQSGWVAFDGAKPATVSSDGRTLRAILHNWSTHERSARLIATCVRPGDEEAPEEGAGRGVGDGEADRLDGRKGGDDLYGEGGDDRLDGHGGDDELLGGAGHDRLLGGAGADLLADGAGATTALAGPGADRIAVADGRGDDTVRCGPGDDVVFADRGDDVAADCETVYLRPAALRTSAIFKHLRGEPLALPPAPEPGPTAAARAAQRGARDGHAMRINLRNDMNRAVLTGGGGSVGLPNLPGEFDPRAPGTIGPRSTGSWATFGVHNHPTRRTGVRGASVTYEGCTGGHCAWLNIEYDNAPNLLSTLSCDTPRRRGPSFELRCAVAGWNRTARDATVNLTVTGDCHNRDPSCP